jgi:lysophospholipase L1-like esterase
VTSLLIVHWALILLFALLCALGFTVRRPATRLRIRTGKAILVLAGLTLGIVLGEGYFLYVYDKTDGWLGLPSSRRWISRHVRYNRYVYRDTRADPDRPASLRIVALGDSFTFGQGIRREEDRFPDLLERNLRNQGIDAAVGNISYPGWDTRKEIAALEEYFRDGRPAPHVVLLGYVPDDHLYYVSDADLGRATPRGEGPPALERWLLDKSCLAGLARALYLRLTDPGTGQSDRLFALTHATPFVWEKHSADLRRLISLCRERGILLQVVIFPFFNQPWESYLYASVHERVAALFREEGVLVTDLLEEYRRYPVAELVVGWLDGHPNERAHRLAAERIQRAGTGSASAHVTGSGARSRYTPPRAAASESPGHR